MKIAYRNGNLRADLDTITFNTIINNYAHLFSSKEYVTQIYT